VGLAKIHLGSAALSTKPLRIKAKSGRSHRIEVRTNAVAKLLSHNDLEGRINELQAN